MSIKKYVILFLLMLIFSQTAYARLYDPSRAKKRPGSVVKTKKPSMKKVKTSIVNFDQKMVPVTNWTERRYDKNKDKFLSGEESRKLLKDRYARIKNKKNPKVETGVEALFDVNKNKKLENNEKAAMKKAIS